MFLLADADCDGMLTIHELAKCLEDPGVKAYFYALEMDPSEARSMFTIMDRNGDGLVDIEEFIAGCMQLRGNAKSIDMMALLYDNAIFLQQFTTFTKLVTDQMDELRKANADVSLRTSEG